MALMGARGVPDHAKPANPLYRRDLDVWSDLREMTNCPPGGTKVRYNSNSRLSLLQTNIVAAAANPRQSPNVEPRRVTSSGGQRDSHDFRIAVLAVIGLHQASRAGLFLISGKSVFHPPRPRTCLLSI